MPELIPFLAMAGFAGIRRSELVREYVGDQVLRWEDILRELSKRMGNSEAVCKRHYLETLAREEGEARYLGAPL
jgi:hypothetical protein